MSRATNPAFFDGLITAWREAGVAPTPVEMSVPNLEHLLLAAAAGAGAALVPESTARRYAISGVRFLTLSPPARPCTVVILTRPDNTKFATSAFLRLAQLVSTPAHAVDGSVELSVVGVPAHGEKGGGGSPARP
jgi:DNA-binding transcriptional LysR family regulator